jgi:hypothetical protein
MKGENLMADEYETETGCSISEAELEKMYAGKYLGAADVGDRKIRAKILRVYSEELRQQDGTMRGKAILALQGLDKTLPLNVTNTLILKGGLDKDPKKWIGRTIGLRTVPRTVGGRATRGIEVVILGAFKAAAAPMPTKPKPAPKAAAAEWPEEPDDPGFDPDFNDSPDFDQAAE